MKKQLYTLGLVVLTAVFFADCNKPDDNNPSNQLDRKPMLENYANNYILPGYDAMVVHLLELKTSIESFTQEPTANQLQLTKGAFEGAYKAWQKIDLLEFGPTVDKSLRSYMNIYPVTVSKVESNITAGNYDLETFGNKDAQGFPAIDYLLNGITLDKYTTDAQAASRKQYLLAVINKMLDKMSEVRTEWDTYKNTFVSSTGTDAGSSFSQMVNGYVQYYERYLRAAKIGLPVGAMTGVAKPELAEAYYSPDMQRDLAIEGIRAAINFYEGKSYDGATTGESLSSYLSAIGTKDDNGTLMADVILDELKAAESMLAKLQPSISQEVVNNRTKVLEAYEQLQLVVPLLKVDMISAFSISVTYTDNDGD